METKQVFDAVANKYDLMNDIMSLGTHRYWKECLIDWLKPYPGMNIIDVAGGTGDISRRFLKRVSGNGKATICDPNASMLKNGSKNVDKYEDSIIRTCAFAEELPFENESFDAYIVSFGIRNFTDIQRGLEEAMRVVKPGGYFICSIAQSIFTKNGFKKEIENLHKILKTKFISRQFVALPQNKGSAKSRLYILQKLI